MDKGWNPPPYGWGNANSAQPPPAAPPSYSQAVGGVGPSSPYTPQYPPCKKPESSKSVFFKIVIAKYGVIICLIRL